MFDDQELILGPPQQSNQDSTDQPVHEDVALHKLQEDSLPKLSHLHWGGSYSSLDIISISHPLVVQIDHSLGPERSTRGHPRSESPSQIIAHPNRVGMVAGGFGHIAIFAEQHPRGPHTIDIPL